MFNRMKVSFLVIGAIVLFLSISWMVGSSFGETVKAQEPSIVETVHQEAVFDEVDHTALPDTINEAVFNEVDVTEPIMPGDTGSEESSLLNPTADTVDDTVLPAIPANTGSNLTRWESSHLQAPVDSVDYATPATSVNSGTELSMWERVHLSK